MFLKVSIIIPVLDEQAVLAQCLQRLQQFRRQGHELIVVDGGSRDNSLQLAQQAADQVLVSPPGRALQMNAGSEVASGDVLLFLHADTRLPDEAMVQISRACQQAGDTAGCWGRFDVCLSSPRPVFRLIAAMMNLRSRVSGIATGDQAIFVAATLFRQVGAYPEIALMEDIAISRRLKRQCRPCCLQARVTTSSRRWEQKGVLTTILLMWRLRLLYFLGVSPNHLQRLYR